MPGLAELERAPSIRVNQQENLIQAIDYDPGLGSRNLSPDHVDSTLTLIPENDDPGPAFAMWQVYTERTYAGQPTYDPVLTLGIDEDHVQAGSYLVIANYSTGRWDLFPLQYRAQDGTYDAWFGDWQDYSNQYRVMTFGILATEASETTLRWLRFGDGFRPEITSDMTVSPLPGGTGELAAMINVHAEADPAFGGLEKIEVDFDNDSQSDYVSQSAGGDNVSFTAHWELPAAGEYRPRITVTSGSGAVYQQYLDRAWLGESGTAAPQARMMAGNSYRAVAGEDVLLDASGSTAGNAPIEHYYWFVDEHPLGDSTQPQLNHRFDRAGIYEVRLQVVDANFNMSDDIQLLTVAESAAGWEASVVQDAGLLQQFASRHSIAVISGLPALITQGSPDNSAVVYWRAAEAAAGSLSGNPQLVAAPQTEQSGLNGLGLLEHLGRPLVYFSQYLDDSAQTVIYTSEAESAEGQEWSQPVACFSINGQLDLNSLQMEQVSGQPAILYRSKGANGSWFYRSAVDANGKLWNAAVELTELSQTENAGYARLTDWDGIPCIAWSASVPGEYQAAFFMKAGDSTGSSWNSPVIIASNPESGIWVLDLAIIGGKPALALVDDRLDQLKRGYKLAYASCISEDGSVWSDPSHTGAFMAYRPGNLLDYGGVPAIVAIGNPYQSSDFAQLCLFIARDSKGSSWQAPYVLNQKLDSELIDGFAKYRDICMSVNGVPTALLPGDRDSLLSVVFN
ncbi:hypothetical protein KDL44_09675 [bacterium]|nr:hypothetical protein [bacterium]